ncbi:CoA transferase [Amycolatopsis magusensis]|uniref:Crotonobetainyl-CoA:carnitine CoA-transferase CaiB-like acyl-CoA transferase n=1 Tax=Amycolatopsis magusensis TaxID=882444 RepID=A0ABS4PR00_9PSEU|nr:CoA transferase [Amycolatopsis magusensis]MBP2181859.1 crotonobetainyl-CoA:carnitine CoA-transferase CaiB-like acyl-CoA transferase [Amycolatopsis magusensis]
MAGPTPMALEPDCEIDWAGPVALPLADEPMVQAACGLMHVHGRRSGHPEPITVDYASTVAKVFARQGALAASIATARGLPLRSVRTSVAQAALHSVAQYLAVATTDDDWRELRGTGGPPFLTADGVRVEIETLNAEDWCRFWSRLGASREAIRTGWPPFQQRFGSAVCPLPDELASCVAARLFHSVAVAGAATGVSVVQVRECAGDLTGPPFRITPLGAPGSALPPASARPLDGLVVVESTRRVQGPLAGHVLRLLGAEVIRVEPPGGDPARWVPPIAGDCSARFLALNRGKSAVDLDLATSAGRADLLELLTRAHVFLHNWAPGKAARWNLDADRLLTVHPGLVYASASGWGDAFGDRAPLGTDYLVQAHSGLAAALRPSGAPSLMTLTDVLGGLVCAEGVLAALLDRVRTGQGARVDSSLYSATSLIPQTRPQWTASVSVRDGRLHGTGEPIEVCTDLAELAADPRFGAALGHDGFAYPLPPWEFA